MSKPKWLKQIEERAGKKAVLLVEGNTDLRILGYFLDQISPSWDTGIAMLPASRKSQVINVIQDYHPEWVGIVDKDEWPVEQTNKVLLDVPRVKALPRFCLENFFCVPQELWNALPPTSKQILKHDPDQLTRPILAVLPDWVAHGAIWRVIRGRRNVLLYESGFPAKLDSNPVTDIAQIRKILEEWHEQLQPEKIIDEYRQELAAAQKRTTDQQLKLYIHGKKFFKQVIVPTLNNLFGQASPSIWSERFSQTPYGLKTPSDLDSFLQNILNLFK